MHIPLQRSFSTNLTSTQTEQDNMNVTLKGVLEPSCQILGTTHLLTTKLPSEKLVVNHIFAIAFNGILIIPTLFLNGVAVITILRSSQLNGKPCYFIILLQSIFDIAVGILAIPLFIYYLASSIGGISNCFAHSLARRLMHAPIEGSSITVTALTLERYIAILHPFTYKAHVTKNRLLKFVSGMVTVEFLVIVLSLKSRWLLQIYIILKVTLVFFITAVVYTRIYLVVKKLARSQMKPNDDNAEKNLKKMKLFLQEIRQARSCFIVVVCFFALSFLPPIVSILFLTSINAYKALAFRIWVSSLTILNSSVNSLIFFWTKTMLRKEALKILNAV